MLNRSRFTLVYDGQCAACSRVAQLAHATGKLKVASLQDSQTIAILDAAAPGWKHQPYLLAVDADGVTVLSGVKMAARLASIVGPRTAARLVAELGQEQAGVEDGLSRRTALGRGIMATTGLLLGVGAVAEPALARTGPPVAVVDAAVIGRIERLVGPATQHLGEVRHVTHVPGRPSIYLVEHHQDHAYTAVDDQLTFAGSYRLKVIKGHPLAEYLHADGKVLAYKNMRTGKAAATLPEVTQATATDAISVQCGQYIYNCVTPQSEGAVARAINCGAAAACAGRPIVRCGKDCIGAGGPVNYAKCVTFCFELGR